MLLDVGCGDRPTGDVNCDLYINDTEGHRTPIDPERYTIKTKTIKNFVLCDASHLPFKDDAFDSVFSGQVIEHVNTPQLMLRELIRVSNDKVVVECPHRIGERISAFKRKQQDWLNKHHINHLNPSWFMRSATALGCSRVVSELTKEQPFPNSVLRLLTFPLEFRVTITK